MNIQIFGKSKCFDTKKAQRYFLERRIRFQQIDLAQKGMSKGELESVRQAVGSYKELIDPKSKDYAKSCIAYVASEENLRDKLLAYPSLLRTPIVHNGRQATIGYCPDVWKTWE